MAKNLMPNVCKMLGVELGEKFKIKGDVGTYEFGLEGLWGDYGTDAETLEALVCGGAEIIKLHYRPDYRQMYWTFGLKDGIWVVVPREWEDYPAEILLADKGWTYRTKEAAKDALPKVAAEFGVEYKL